MNLYYPEYWCFT